jgi:hypothetical protein
MRRDDSTIAPTECNRVAELFEVGVVLRVCAKTNESVQGFVEGDIVRDMATMAAELHSQDERDEITGDRRT